MAIDVLDSPLNNPRLLAHLIPDDIRRHEAPVHAQRRARCEQFTAGGGSRTRGKQRKEERRPHRASAALQDPAELGRRVRTFGRRAVEITNQ